MKHDTRHIARSIIQDISHESMKQAYRMEGMNAQGIQRRRVSQSHPSKTCRLPNICIPRAVCIPELSTYKAIDKLIIQHTPISA